MLRGGEGSVRAALLEEAANEAFSDGVGWDEPAEAALWPAPAALPLRPTDCTHGGRFVPAAGGGTGGDAGGAGRCSCAPLFSGRRCERAPSGDADVAASLLEGIEWRLPAGQPLVLYQGAPRYSEGGGAPPSRLLPELRERLPAAPDGEVFAAARGAAGARGRCAAVGGSPLNPSDFVEAQALDLVLKQVGPGAGPLESLAADVVAVGQAWVNDFLLTGAGPAKGEVWPPKVIVFPEVDGYGRKQQERWTEAVGRLAAADPPLSLLVASEQFTRHAAAVRERLRLNAGEASEREGVAPLPAAPSGALDFSVLLFSLQGCARVHVFGPPPAATAEADAAGGAPVGPGAGSKVWPLADPATAGAALLAQVATGAVRATSGSGAAAAPALAAYTMFSPKYAQYYRNLRDSFEVQGGEGWMLRGVEVPDEKFSLAKGTNKLRGSSRRLRLLLAQLKRRLGSADPFFCWMDTTTLVADELLWRPYSGKDLYLPPESRFGNPTQAANMCFMCIRANDRTLAFFSQVLTDVVEDTAWEQDRVNVRLAEGFAQLRWDWIPSSVVDIMAAKHDDCTTGRSAAVYKFISMATKKEAYPPARSKTGELYHAYLDLVRGRRQECPAALQDRAEKKWAALLKQRGPALEKQEPGEERLAMAARRETERRSDEETGRKRSAQEKRKEQRKKRQEQQNERATRLEERHQREEKREIARQKRLAEREKREMERKKRRERKAAMKKKKKKQEHAPQAEAGAAAGSKEDLSEPERGGSSRGRGGDGGDEGAQLPSAAVGAGKQEAAGRKEDEGSAERPGQGERPLGEEEESERMH